MPLALHPPGEQVEGEAAHGELGGATLVGHAQVSPNPRRQLVEGERLGHVVRGAGVQGGDLVGHLAAGGQHDHRQRGLALADRVEHAHAVLPREHHVEDHQVHVAAERAALALLAVGSAVHDVALGLEAAAYEIRYRGLVFDNQDAQGPLMLGLTQAFYSATSSSNGL